MVDSVTDNQDSGLRFRSRRPVIINRQPGAVDRLLEESDKFLRERDLGAQRVLDSEISQGSGGFSANKITATRVKKSFTGLDDLAGLLGDIDEGLQELIDITNNPRRATLGPAQGVIRAVRIDTANVVKQGPDLAIPPGFNITVVQRRHSGTHTGYVAFSEIETKNSMERHEMRDADAWSVNVSNMSDLFFNAETVPTGGLFFELIAQR